MTRNKQSQRIVNNFLNANEKTENNFLTAVLLNKSLRWKEKELLLFIYHLAHISPELKIHSKKEELAEIDPLQADITLNDLHKLEITYPSTASKLLNGLHNDGVVVWNKENHTIAINPNWAGDVINSLDEQKILFFYKLLLKQI